MKKYKKRRVYKPLVAWRLACSTLLLISLPLIAETKPNVVIIYGDDVGYGDVGAYGAEMIPTPHIDRLAAGGLMFTDGHCAAATCTPSRFSLLTGTHGFRMNVSVLPPDAPLCIPTDTFTLPDLFKQAGYATAVIGKWHLGIGEQGTKTDWNGKVAPGPLEIGFDYSYLLPSTNDRVPCVYLENYSVVNLDPNDPIHLGLSKDEVDRPGSTPYPDAKKSPEAMTYYKSSHGHNNSVINGIGRMGYMSGGKTALWNDETMADEFVNKARRYIEEHMDEPFFLFFASQDIHVPRAPHPRFQGRTKLGYRGDAMVQFDWSTGEIMKALDENGLTENTIVIFSSDNGPVYDDGYRDGTSFKRSVKEVDRGHDGSGIYRGGKYQVYEGGTRVPLIIHWPDKINPGKNKAMVNQIDFLASFAAMFDIALPEGQALDSRNTLSTFLGEDEQGLPFMIEEGPKDIALRVGSLKYVVNLKGKGGKNTKEELYDLESDPSEQKNILSQYPEKAQRMSEQLENLINASGVR